MAENLNALFNESQVVQPVGESNEEAKKKEAKKELKNNISAAFEDKLRNDPSFPERSGILSSSLEVVNTLAVDNNEGFIQTAPASSGKRQLQTTSGIVGYAVKNIGKEPIPFKTRSWAKNESGNYVPTNVEDVIQPGAVAALTRYDMAILGARDEISFTLSNGYVKTAFGKKGEGLAEVLEKFHFEFNKGLGKTVHDDSVKIRIDEPKAKESDPVVVKPEYMDRFAYLMNTKAAAATKKGAKSAVKKNISTQAMIACYVQKQAAAEGIEL